MALVIVAAIAAAPRSSAASPGLDAIACANIDRTTCPALALALDKPEITAAELGAWLDHAPPDADRVRKAASVLSIIGGDVARKHLGAAITRFGDDVPFAVDLHAAAARLGVLTSRDALVQLARSGDTRARVVALSTLDALAEPAALEIARAALHDADPRLGAVAAKTLGRSEQAADVDALLALASAGDVALPLRRAVLHALAARGERRAALAAAQLVTHPARDVAIAALAAVGAAKAAWTAPAVAWAMRQEGLRAAGARAAVALGAPQLGEVALAELLTVELEDRSFNALLEVVAALKPADGARRLLDRVEGAGEARRVTTLRAISEMGDRAVVPRLIEALVSARGPVANFTVHALEALTGERLGGDVEVWRTWLRGGPAAPPGADTTR